MTKQGDGVPQLPVSCLAEFVCKGRRSAESVLRPYKFRTRGEGRARIVFYPPVMAVIRKYFKLDRDIRVFESAVAKWQSRAEATDKKALRSRLHSDIAALNLFRLRYKDTKFQILPIHRISCQIGQIVFTASPDLWVKENNRERLIKIGFGKKKRSYIDTLLVVMRRAALIYHHRIRPSNAVYLDISTGEELLARFAYRELALTLTAAAREIAETWPRVTLETLVPPGGKITVSAVHDRASYPAGS